jgi:hypothetical protein
MMLDLGFGKIHVPDDVRATKRQLLSGVRLTFVQSGLDEIGYIDMVQRPGGLAVEPHVRSTDLANDERRCRVLQRIADDIDVCVAKALVDLRRPKR